MESAVSADFLDFGSSLLKPMRKNELILVNSQKINKASKLSDRTTPSMEAINMDKYP
ncbi:hypothetical protein GCM10008106_07450 [Mongoliitalea lutea]|uniref:Uncharacterized protein n=1 Tax=Mongoliitalea lutea TaxID=849756 RepID=A0A8J3CWC7_9BACT|nr:hypothetical protein GCM10008106_07450 [Mongoliitalea lutea]